MSQRRKPERGVPQARRALPPAFLIFAENPHDGKTIQAFVGGLRPDLKGTLRTLREPLVLVKKVRREELLDRVERLKRQVAAQRVVLNVRGVLIHEDCDDVEPAHLRIEKKYEEAFRGAPFEVHPVLPAWEMETWLMQWPSVMPVYRRSWREPDEFRNRDLGMIRDAKETLIKALIPRDLSKAERARFRSYQESDSPGIATVIAESRLVRVPEARSASFHRFSERVRGLAISPPAAR